MGKLIVISGPSGVGKGTVVKAMMAKEDNLFFSVSATTRPPRPGEVDGKDYYFVDRERFLNLIHRGEMLEYDEHNMNFYGTPKQQVEEKRRLGHVLLDIEPIGARNVKNNYPEAVLVFIMPPSVEELEHRLRGRNDTIPIDDPETYQLYSEGRTIGTFQFESAGMQKYLRELHPTTTRSSSSPHFVLAINVFPSFSYICSLFASWAMVSSSSP